MEGPGYGRDMSTLPTSVALPHSSDPAEQARRVHTSQRHRIMTGEYAQPGRDLDQRIERAIGIERADVWKGTVDGSANVASQGCDQLGTLYSVEPIAHHVDAASLPLLELVDRSPIWSMMPRHQATTLGLRESWIRVNVARGKLVYRMVPAHMVEAIGYDDDPATPCKVRELRLRNGKWTYDVLDIRNPKAPIMRVEDTEGRILQTFEEYPYREADGTPVLPHVLYHAEGTGQLYDPYRWHEAFDGTLTLGLLWSMFVHVCVSASWPQRYLIGAEPQGGAAVDGRSSITADQASILMLRHLEGYPGAPVAGSWTPGADPSALQAAVAAYESRIVSMLGVGAGDIARTSDPRSGYSLVLSREAQREAARRYMPIFRASDRELVRISAILANRAGLTIGAPEDGYDLAYQSLPASVHEQQAELTRDKTEIELGLLSPVEAFMRRNPGIDYDRATVALDKIAAERRRWASPLAA